MDYKVARILKRFIDILNEQVDELTYKNPDPNLTIVLQSLKTARSALTEYICTQQDNSK